MFLCSKSWDERLHCGIHPVLLQRPGPLHCSSLPQHHHQPQPDDRTVQVYVRSRKSVSTRAAAEHAFASHCRNDLVLAAYGLAGDSCSSTTLYQPAAWPHTLGMRAWLSDSRLATLWRDSSVLEGHVWRLMASYGPQGLAGEGYSSRGMLSALTGLSQSASRWTSP